MSLMQMRGGIPRVTRDTINATGRRFDFPFRINFLIVRVDTVSKMYFTEDDYDNDANYVTINTPAAAIPQSGEWRGPVEAERVWILAAGGADVEVVGFQQRG